MRPVPIIILSIILASSTLGYGLASAQMWGTPCTASHPCARICGDHPCAPGEVYTPGGQGTTNSTAQTSSSTNNTKTPAISTQMTLSANATATKTGKSIMSENASMTANVTATKSAISNMAKMNGTMTNTTGTATTTVPPPAPVLSPLKQISSGIAPSDVKCPSGYQLALNKFDSRPACVTADGMAKLVARGWAKAA
ncbi:MAG: hypothetical protein KGI27_12265 [Thaumarchaeota archaeon]|nr:hypothetical protein [Nitrososphaerota archaeon]